MRSVSIVSVPPDAIASRRVDREVHEHLLDLPWIRTDGARPAQERRVDLDVLAEQAREQADRVGDGAVEVERRELLHLAAAEGEELPRQLGRAVAGVRDLVEVRAQLVVAADALERERGVAADRGEQVVEVVRDAARELPDGLEPLRLAEALLEAASAR